MMFGLYAYLPFLFLFQLHAKYPFKKTARNASKNKSNQFSNDGLIGVETKTNIQRLVDSLRKSFTDLGTHTTDEHLEYLAVFLNESMATSGRFFHNVEHVFDISMDACAITVISALFHDVIYYQVDGELSLEQAGILQGVLCEDEESSTALKLNTIDSETDPLFAMVADIFGFSSGEVLNPFGGQNEFLSAMVAVRALDGTLQLSQMAQIAACIEATIPFRSINAEGKTPADLLYLRLVDVNNKFQLHMTEEDIVETIHLSVDLSNRDVRNFSSSDTGYFLEQTWKLLPESNVPLRQKTLYTVFDYYNALFKLEKFFSNLDSNVVFRHFRDRPDEMTRQALNRQAALNLEIGCSYVRAKLLSIAILAAIAHLTGGDVPMSFITGDLPEIERCAARLDDKFSQMDTDKGTTGTFQDEKVYELLMKGRRMDSSFDARDSPMAAYLYRMIGAEGVNKSLEYAVVTLDNVSSSGLLKSLPRGVLAEIVRNTATIVEIRADKLLTILEELN